MVISGMRKNNEKKEDKIEGNEFDTSELNLLHNSLLTVPIEIAFISSISHRSSNILIGI